MCRFCSVLLLLLLSLFPLSGCLPNGVGLTPAMGFSSWNAFSSNVTEAKIKQIVKILITTGLAAKGYHYINIDEGWLQSRSPDTSMIMEDRSKFPSGMRGLGDWIHSQEVCHGCGQYFKYGLYTSRGTCQCSEWDYHAPGSQGYEKLDVQWMVNAGADYLKVDSCCSSSDDHARSFADYSIFRDALNATGRQVYFSLCGWNEWYAPPDPSLNYTGGASLGNSWRIAGDGSNWGALSNCMNVIARVHQYAGPGGWNDPDLLIGPNVIADGSYSTDVQARTQFNVWSVMAAPLLISNNLIEASEYNIATYGNEEIIAINQDPIGTPGYRMFGSDLSYPCIEGINCINIWGRKLMNGDFALVFVNNGGAPSSAVTVTCDASCFSQMNFNATTNTNTNTKTNTLIVRDLWTTLETVITEPFIFSAAVDGDGGSNIYRIRTKHMDMDMDIDIDIDMKMKMKMKMEIDME